MSTESWKKDFKKSENILDKIKEVIFNIRKPEVVRGYSYERDGKEIKVDKYRRKKRKKKLKFKEF